MCHGKPSAVTLAEEELEKRIIDWTFLVALIYHVADDKIIDNRGMVAHVQAQSVALREGDPKLEDANNGGLKASIRRKRRDEE